MSAPRIERETAEHVRGELAGASNVLVLAGADAHADDLCPQLLLTDEPDQTNLLWVTYTNTPDSCMQSWLQHAGERPADVKVVSVGDMMRSATAAQSGGHGPSPSPMIDSVSNPADLTGLGIKISEQLQTWSHTANQTVACYDSLTTALQYVDLQTLYKFLHVLTGRFEAVGTTAHFHIDPAAHDEATVNTLKSLFDAVVEPRGGQWHVSRR